MRDLTIGKNEAGQRMDKYLKKYFPGLVIVDDFSRFTWVFFLQEKSETQGTLERFLRRAQNEFELKVKKIRSDNGSEFRKRASLDEYNEYCHELLNTVHESPYSELPTIKDCLLYTSRCV